MTKIQNIFKGRRIKRKIKGKTFMLFGCPQKKGTCNKIKLLAPKKPNSANRKVAKIVFSSKKRSTFCFIPGIKHSLQKFSTVLLRGGRTKDLPGLKYKAIRGVFDLKEVYLRYKARSKYGIKKLRAL